MNAAFSFDERSYSISTKPNDGTPVKFFDSPNLNQFVLITINVRKFRHYADLIKELKKSKIFKNMKIFYFYSRYNGSLLQSIDQVISAEEVIVSSSSTFKMNDEPKNTEENKIKVQDKKKDEVISPIRLPDSVNRRGSICNKEDFYKNRRLNFYKNFVSATNLTIIKGNEILTKTFEQVKQLLCSLGLCEFDCEIRSLAGDAILSVEDIFKCSSGFIVKSCTSSYTAPKSPTIQGIVSSHKPGRSDSISADPRITLLKRLSSKTIESEDDYCNLEYLEAGNMSKIYKAVKKTTGETLVLKIIDNSLKKTNPEVISREINILGRVKCSNIVRFYTSFENDKGTFIVLEYAPHGDCFQLLGKEGTFSERMAAKVVNQVAIALRYLQSNSIIHRDIKLENLLVFNKEEDTISIKVADFGLAIKTTMYKCETEKCGTIYYISPEMLNGNGYAYEIDIYALGIVAYVLLVGYFPYKSEDGEESDRQIYSEIIKGNLRFSDDLWNYISPEARILIKKLLDKNPASRPTADKICESRWIQKNSR